jgi:hypothetical protein
MGPSYVVLAAAATHLAVAAVAGPAVSTPEEAGQEQDPLRGVCVCVAGGC